MKHSSDLLLDKLSHKINLAPNELKLIISSNITIKPRSLTKSFRQVIYKYNLEYKLFI